MRLIDADKLNFSEQHYNKSQMKAILDFIDNQPTAYDVNKVVNQLEMSKKTALDLVNLGKLPHFFIKSLQELVDICFDRAIEIVKAGGRGNVNTESKS